jgi:hypothetical protein
VRGAEDTSERQLRAYVTVTGAEPRFNKAGELTAAIRFTNCGQTPAYAVSVTIPYDFAILGDTQRRPTSRGTQGDARFRHRADADACGGKSPHWLDGLEGRFEGRENVFMRVAHYAVGKLPSFRTEFPPEAEPRPCACWIGGMVRRS